MRYTFTLFALLLITHSAYLQTPATFARLEAQLASASTPAAQVGMLQQLADSVVGIRPAQAKGYAGRALAVANASTDVRLLAQANLLAGRTWQKNTSFDTAALYFEEARMRFQQLGDAGQTAEAEFGLGSVFANQRVFSKAAEHLVAAQKIWESTSYYNGLARLYLVYTDFYGAQGEHEQGASYAAQALETVEKTDDWLLKAEVYTNRAYGYLGLRQPEQALVLAEKGLAAARKGNGSLFLQTRCLNMIGNSYKHLKQFDQAITYYRQVEEVSKQIGYERGLMLSNANIGHTLILKEDYKGALPYTLKAIAFMQQSKDYRNLEENLTHALHCYEELGDYPKAYEYSELLREEQQRLYDEEKSQLQKGLVEKYNAGQREATVAIQNQQIKQQKTIQWLGFSVAGLLAVLLFSLYRSYRARTRTNQQLAAKNAENELLLKEIHHRVKNNLQTISSLLNLQSASIADPNALEAVRESQSRVRSMALIHQKLYQGENLAAVNMKDYLETLSQSTIQTFGPVAQRVQLHLPMEEIELDVDTAIPIGLITNELLTNSLKYAFPDNRTGSIEVSLTRQPDHQLRLHVADDGVGSVANAAPQGTGFGTRLVQLLTLQLGGQLQRQTSAGTSTTVQFAVGA